MNGFALGVATSFLKKCGKAFCKIPTSQSNNMKREGEVSDTVTRSVEVLSLEAMVTHEFWETQIKKDAAASKVYYLLFGKRVRTNGKARRTND
jgi:hypothetical protein